MTRARRMLPAASRWLAPVAPVAQTASAIREYRRFLSSWRSYSRLPGAEALRFEDSYPCLFDRTATTPYDAHYFHQAVWAAERILRSSPDEHVDVGSEVTFVGLLSVNVPVVFVDIRPLPVQMPALRSIVGDLLGGLPFDDGSVSSLSCLHVAEHVGLGRYGDRLAADGTAKACAELTRVIAPGGTLYFSVPVGRPRVCFNAHRIHAPRQILRYFDDLVLREFAMVNDEYQLVHDADLDQAAEQSYACGLFAFSR